MRYVGKIMLEKPYPVLCSTKDLSLYLQLGTAVFQHDKDASDFSCRVKHHPIVVPVNIHELDDDVYCSVNTSEELVPLCLQGDTLPVSAFNIPLRNVSCGSLEECLDFSSLWEYYWRGYSHFDITVPEKREINLTLTFGNPNGNKKYFWHTLLLNEDSIASPVYLWSTSNSIDSIVIDLVRRAIAYNDIFVHKRKIIPCFSFSAPYDADEEIKQQVEEINRLFHYTYILRWYITHFKKYGYDIIKIIKNILPESPYANEVFSIDFDDLSSCCHPYYTPEQVHDFLEGMSYFKITFTYTKKVIYYGIVQKDDGDNYDIVSMSPDQLMRENRELFESPLRKYIFEKS